MHIIDIGVTNRDFYFFIFFKFVILKIRWIINFKILAKLVKSPLGKNNLKFPPFFCWINNIIISGKKSLKIEANSEWIFLNKFRLRLKLEIFKVPNYLGMFFILSNFFSGTNLWTLLSGREKRTRMARQSTRRRKSLPIDGNFRQI